MPITKNADAHPITNKINTKTKILYANAMILEDFLAELEVTNSQEISHEVDHVDFLEKTLKSLKTNVKVLRTIRNGNISSDALGNSPTRGKGSRGRKNNPTLNLISSVSRLNNSRGRIITSRNVLNSSTGLLNNSRNTLSNSRSRINNSSRRQNDLKNNNVSNS